MSARPTGDAATPSHRTAPQLADLSRDPEAVRLATNRTAPDAGLRHKSAAQNPRTRRQLRPCGGSNHRASRGCAARSTPARASLRRTSCPASGRPRANRLKIQNHRQRRHSRPQQVDPHRRNRHAPAGPGRRRCGAPGRPTAGATRPTAAVRKQTTAATIAARAPPNPGAFSPAAPSPYRRPAGFR